MNDSGAPTDEKDMAHIYLDELQHLAAAGRRRRQPAMADSTARALVFAESQGLSSHGLSRVPFYAGHLRAGRAIGSAVPRIVRERGAALIDAGSGLAFPACALAVEQAGLRAREHGVAFIGVTNSHHFGEAGYHLEAMADLGLVGLALSNSPAAMPAWGGKRPLFGTNPIAAVFPRRGGARLVIDLSLSQVARGKLMIAARDNQPIPLGWALDADGNPTTDPRPGGQHAARRRRQGAMLALIVELLACALTGSHFGFETESFFVDEGGPARLGQAFMAIDPGALAGNDAYLERVETLVDVMLEDEHVRLPGDRRRKLRDEALKHGVELPEALMAQLRAMAGAS